MKEVDSRPESKGVRIGPVNPFRLRENRPSGEAIIEFIVNAKGKVTEAKVLKATHKEFGDAALDAVKQWKFIPAKKNGVPVACRMRVPIVFNTDD